MTRNGKIARLPEPIREHINRRLQDGENGRDIIVWLNSLDEVKAVLASEFGGQEINDTNLSQWENGGFREWGAKEAAREESRRILSEGLELSEAGEKVFADRMAVWLLGRYAVASRKLIENPDDPGAWKLLRELCHDVVNLRRGEHGAEWLRLERERIELLRQRNQREDKAAKSASEPPALPPMDNEELDRHYRQIFGMEPR